MRCHVKSHPALTLSPLFLLPCLTYLTLSPIPLPSETLFLSLSHSDLFFCFPCNIPSLGSLPALSAFDSPHQPPHRICPSHSIDTSQGSTTFAPPNVSVVLSPLCRCQVTPLPSQNRSKDPLLLSIRVIKKDNYSPC
jgi:hypothetical protein